MDRKGFPESYDIHALVDLVTRIKAGEADLRISVYSHVSYDVVQNHQRAIGRPDVVIVEGVNVLQAVSDGKGRPNLLSLSDLLDFSIYVDADPDLIESWYVKRFMELRLINRRNPHA